MKLQTRFSSRSDELLYDFYNQIKWFVTNLWPDFTMAEIIDLEDTDYDSIYGQEGDPQYRMGPTPNSMSDGKTAQQPQPRLITIKSYTEICIEAGDSASPEESSPRVKPKFHKTDTKFRDSNNNNSRLADPTPDTSRKFSRPIMKFPKSKDKVNVWTRQKNVQVKRRERVPCWLVVFIFCCGVSKEHQWYSLLGKGVFLAFFMSIVYLVASLAVLPFLIIAAAVSAVFFGASMVSYFAFSSKKVGVSFDDDGDGSCLRTVWGSWV